MGRKIIDLTGQKFGRLTVVKRAENKGAQTFWLCICECEVEHLASSGNLKAGRVTSCGCRSREVTSARSISHGLSKHPLYEKWKGILNRCTNSKRRDFKHYGGRGITVCDEWKNDLSEFYNWCMKNGYKEGLEIDRRDNDGNYEPSNCRFVTRRGNVLNKRMKPNISGYEGITLCNGDGKWMARITIRQSRIYLGVYFTIKEAVEARNNYIIENNIQHEYDVQKWRSNVQ